ncbi:androgen dependent TFPI regulating protein 1 [Erpetoichthys calabaricus]|uniref:androgen dependent TFPI regulating protein 1 n=1 Tax=Erpetoichthys calabaricus TaxID=27687 RepID=UPI0022347E46|nr:androgen dependent TFPI regulating protein 1 [Erpetoichthys calabaricus]
MAASTGRINGPLVVVIHIVLFCWYVFTVWRNCSITITAKHPGVKTYGGRWKYLTFINLILQTVYFGICILADVTQLWSSVFRHKESLVKVRDNIFALLAFPVGAFVVLSFWSIYAFDRELVYPIYLDSIIPQWLNHAMHTVILPLLLIELFTTHHRYPSRKKGILGLICFCCVYLIWIFWVRYASGIWVYPILSHLSPVGLVLFLVVAALGLAPLYLLGEYLNTCLWGVRKKKKH